MMATTSWTNRHCEGAGEGRPGVVDLKSLSVAMARSWAARARVHMAAVTALLWAARSGVLLACAAAVLHAWAAVEASCSAALA
jgi:hypothetical protein